MPSIRFAHRRSEPPAPGSPADADVAADGVKVTGGVGARRLRIADECRCFRLLIQLDRHHPIGRRANADKRMRLASGRSEPPAVAVAQLSCLLIVFADLAIAPLLTAGLGGEFRL